MTSTLIEPLWTIEDVSTYLRVPVDTLYQWRHRRTGPPAAKVGVTSDTNRLPSVPGFGTEVTGACR